MIELKIDGEVYTKKQYEKDYVRMMDSLRKECIGERNCSSVDCEECPLYEETCHTNRDEASDYRCLETVEIVHDWAKAHPGKTNREKFIEIFGSNPPFDTAWEFGKWLDDEYKGK